MGRTWLHIGAPKSGTTALQRYMSANRDALARAGLDYISPFGKTSSNPVAVAVNKNRMDEQAALRADLAERAAQAGGTRLISSEMFFGMTPAALGRVLPKLEPSETEILVYLRRQDRYLESKYVQKLKNARFKGDIWAYIDKFDGSGADYVETLAPWRDAGFGITVRICEPGRLTGGSVVADALGVMGITGAPAEDSEAVNTSPSMERLQLLQLAKSLGVDNMRHFQRNLPDARGSKARFFSPDERAEILARYDTSNAELRRLYLPGSEAVFEPLQSDVGMDPSGFTEDQLAEIDTVMRAVLAARN